MIGAAVLVAWAVLLLFRGGFWRADQRLPREVAAPAGIAGEWPGVVAVIPARNEAATIVDVVGAHRASAYPGGYPVIVVDDGSGDGTGALARAAGAVVVAAPPLPPGWSGKLWALQAGVEHAGRVAPGARWLLLTDADIRHAATTLGRLVALAEEHGLAMASLMARLHAGGPWGGLLVPAFVFFFQMLYPFPWVNRPGHRVAAAAGGCVLIRRDVLETIGGIPAIRGALIDDCALAARVKHHPPERAIWLGLADDEVVSLRDNRRLGTIWSMVARTAFTQLRHSGVLLAGTLAGLALVFLAPPVLLVAGLAGAGWWQALAGAAAMAAMVRAYAPTLRLYGRPWWHGLALPTAAALYGAMTLSSALRHWRGRGGAWKGRTY
jgi:hopene-associated glycosyltransferase HpnB